MKRFLSMIVMLIGMTVATNAMSYSQAREQALFLTDKMAYELNLTDDQYEAAYEINLDYLMSVNSYADLYGDYWRYRNLDLSYVLLDWQYRAFCDAAYFYRPLYYSAGNWHFGIYARYPRRDYFYFNRPTVYVSYRGGHSWGRNNGRSWYNGRMYGPRPGDRHFGMRDGFNRGDFGNGRRQQFGSRPGGALPQPRDNKGKGNGNSFGSRPGGVVSRTVDNNGFGSRTSSTRTTVTRPSTSPSSATERKGTIGSRLSTSTTTSRSLPSTTFTPSQRSNSSLGNSRSNSSFGSSRSSSSSLGNVRSVSPSSGSSRGGSSFGGSSFGGGSRSGGGSSSGSSRGGSFGSRR